MNWAKRFVCAVVLMGISSTMAIGLTDSSVTLQVQMLLGNNGVLIDGAKDVSIRLSYEGDSGEVVMWQKLYEDELISDGVLLLSLSGEDDLERELTVEMFDEEDVQLVVEVDGFEAELALVSQPYAIKANISNESHSALGLQGVPVRSVDNLEDGDILVVKDGEWVATGEADGYTGLSMNYEGSIQLSDIIEVEIDGLSEGQLLRYDGTNWVNSEETSLTEADIADIAGEKGFLQVVSNDAVIEGEYDNILGIGGKITVSPNIELDDDVNITGTLNVMGNVLVDGALGDIESEIGEMYVSSVNIGNVVISEKDGGLAISEKVTITDQSGSVISGTGVVNRFTVYEGVNEVGMADSVIWDATKAQVGIGSISELSGVKLNVDGVLRASDGLVVGTTELTLDEYVVTSDLSLVSFTGSYDDLTVKPNLDDLVDSDELENELNTNYYTQTEVNNEISNELSNYNQNVMEPYVSNELSGYYTQLAINNLLASELEAYYTKTESDGEFINQDELDLSLSNYATEARIRDDILSTYVTLNAVSTVGYTGEYTDILNVPSLVLQSEFDSFESTVTSNYATIVFMENRLSTDLALATSAVLAEVEADYPDNDELRVATDNLYALHIETLHEVARNGSFYDLDDYPNLDLYYLKTEVHETFASMNELVVTLGAYIKHTEVSEVGKTGNWEDIIGAPVMTNYQLVSDMSNYVTTADLSLAISGVSGGGSVDLTSYATISYVTTSLGGYIPNGSLPTVATTGSYNDLTDTDQVVTSSDLDTVLENYVLTSSLSGEIGTSLTGYVDDAGLASELNLLRAEVTTSRNNALSDYYLRTEVSNLINSELEAYQSNVMSVSINAAVNDFLTETEISDLYVDITELGSEISSGMEPYVTTSNLYFQLEQYIKVVSADSLLTDSGAVELVEADPDSTTSTLSVFSSNNEVVTGNIGFYGNVVIGGNNQVYNPTSALEVMGTVSATTIAVEENGGNVLSGIGTNTSQLNVFGKSANGINFEVQNNANAMTIDNNGNVGIGIESYGHKLDVDGDINLSGNYKVNGNNTISWIDVDQQEYTEWSFSSNAVSQKN